MPTFENESRVTPSTCEKLLGNKLKPDLVAHAVGYSANSTHAQYIQQSSFHTSSWLNRF